MVEVISDLQVMRSAAGYYVGRAYLDSEVVPEDELPEDGTTFAGMPYERCSGYYDTEEEAASFLSIICEY